MRLPKKIIQGDLLAITAPSSPLEQKLVIQAKEALEAWGFQVKLGVSCFEDKGYLAGTDQLRAQELNEFFDDDSIKGVICLRGGYGALRILDKLDYKMIEKNPKVFIGFSDVTALHIALQQQCQLVTFHGPMALHMAQGLDPISKALLFRAVGLPKAMGVLGKGLSGDFQFLVPGTAQGQLVGGNLTLVTATLGTPYEIDTKNKLLFLEEVGEAPYRIDRMLTQLGLAGKLSDAQGVILGDFNFDQGELPGPWPILYERLEPFKKPVLWGLRAGHCIPNITIPLGVKARLSSHNNTLEFLEGAVLS